MSDTNKIKYRIDLALKVQDRIEAATGKVAPLPDILNALASWNVTSDYTFWTVEENVYMSLGFDYDEIREVA